MKLNISLCAISVLLFFGCQTKQAEKKVEQKSEVPPAKPVVLLQVGDKNSAFEDLLAKFPKTKISLFESINNSPAEYVGFSLIEVLELNLGSAWRDSDGILFTALDGYKSDVSVKKILKYKPLLAFANANGQPFKIDNHQQNEKDVELGPYYLVWDNLKYPELKREGNYNWPYQIAKIETIQYASHYAKAFPFQKPTANVKEGFDYFKNFCMSCHAVGGEGGEKGPALWPYPALFKGGIKHFTAWVLNPSKMKPGTTMPGLHAELSGAEKKAIASKIYAYLSALHKIKQ